ncbi:MULTISPECIES: DUF1629 domain-containing protein [unclassified Mesorhizobium]|uniref:imm11 family protein n=1 Tax=unclassified Mesorhizobium TaxID=325217 RepID=UPI000BB0BDC9|nr:MULTISPECIES: DUF1629 domain-containing protein [unclassified Mesorhizobium]TGT60178.1 hypothetical protein EN813_026865 [Mesorhizobium sp. M00.F.Ca.ET.170.01.1.1]AZO08342.1 hypothetical protein EJ074_03770 [Mesorhizobium sp. M3A.F.Ca.ET.080.04.2.1]PBB84632.1 hypothetical protein CK216_22180 [Mesorhizobium sp. WSM3876]RWE24796.1 MAG: hypothetical protein EOS41_14520 [Mesorhizobium sp.]RWE31651.1 MAG: hypothetical protein EOS77_16410 [Mesorhizobium sp.]
MAWYIATSLRNEDRPKLTVAPENVAAYDKVCDAMTAQYEQLPKDDPLYAVADPVEMINGFELPDFEPFEIKIRGSSADLPDIISTGMGWLVSDKVRAEIERIEPGRHKFLPARLATDTETGIDRWRFLDICGRLDCVALDASEGVFKRVYDPELPEYFRYLEEGGSKTKIAIWRSCAEGRAIWYDYRIKRRFISDEFAEFIQRECIRGWSLTTFDRPNRVREVEGGID